MTDEDVAKLLAQPYHAVVGMNRKQGPPQLTVVWYYWDGETFRFSTTRDRAKYHNLRRDPAISLLINDFENKWYYVAYGQARIFEDNHDELVQPVLEKYLTAQERARQSWDPDRVIISMRPERTLVGR